MSDELEPMLAGEPDGEPTAPPSWSPSSLFSREASAVAALTFAVLSMLGGTTATSTAQAIVGFPFAADDYRTHVVITAVVLLLFAIAALALASVALRADARELAWPDALARAAAMVAVVGAILAVIAAVGALVQDSPNEVFDL